MDFFSLKEQSQLIKSEINEAISKVLDEGKFIGGKTVENFEEEIADYCGVKYAVSLNSGTDALLLSLRVLGIGQGDEVITTPFTYIATAGVISILGAKPVFVDIDSKTFNIDSSKIKEKITSKTKAIIPVHLFGQAADMKKIMEIAEEHNLMIIEDASQALGSEYEGKRVGSFGIVGCFSFFPSKNLGAFGDGGMIVTSNKDLADKLKILRSNGSLGVNSRLDSIQAAVLKVKFQYLETWNKKRLENAQYYNKLLNQVNNIIVPNIPFPDIHIFHQYTIRAESRDGLKKYLEQKNIQTMIYYSLPLHFQSVFSNLNYRKGDFPKVELAAREVLSLPIYPELKKEQQEYLVRAIKRFYENFKK